jgi:hypothetical protein
MYNNRHNNDHEASAMRGNDRRAEANRANAAKSTGPRTEIGKAVSKLNAVKTALTGRTVLLPGDNVEQYQTHVAQWQADLQPSGPRECTLVQAIADSYWRAERIARLEFAIYAQGHVEFADEFAGVADAAIRQSLIELQVARHNEKQLRNLQIQEGRIRRAREKDMKELNELQRERQEREEETERRKAVVKPGTMAASALQNYPAPHLPVGFEFSPDSATPQTGAILTGTPATASAA